MQETEKKRAGRPKGSTNKTVRLRPEDFYQISNVLLELHELPERLCRLESLLSQQGNVRLSGQSIQSHINSHKEVK